MQPSQMLWRKVIIRAFQDILEVNMRLDGARGEYGSNQACKDEAEAWLGSDDYTLCLSYAGIDKAKADEAFRLLKELRKRGKFINYTDVQIILADEENERIVDDAVKRKDVDSLSFYPTVF